MVKNLFARLRSNNKKVAAAVFGVAMIASAAFGGYSVIKQGSAQAGGDCDSNAIVRCGGYSSTSDSTFDAGTLMRNFRSAGRTAPAAWHYFGINENEFQAAANKSELGVGYVTKNGNVYFNGKRVAYGARTAGRQSIGSSKKVNFEGATFYTRSPSQSFRQSSLTAYIRFNPDGSFKYAMLVVCGNPVSATPIAPPTPKNPSVKIEKKVTKDFSIDTNKGFFWGQETVQSKTDNNVRFLVRAENNGDTNEKIIVDDMLPNGVVYQSGRYEHWRAGQLIDSGNLGAIYGTVHYGTVRDTQPGDIIFLDIIGKYTIASTQTNKACVSIDTNKNGTRDSGESPQCDTASVTPVTSPDPVCNDLWVIKKSDSRYEFAIVGDTGDYTLTKQSVDFGDGTSDSHPGQKLFVHDYTQAGTYTVKGSFMVSSGATITGAKCEKQVTIPATPEPKVPSVKIEKTVNGSEYAELEVGQEFVWQLVVTNNGEVDLSSVVVTDQAPANIEFISSDKGSINQGNFTYTIPNLAVNQSETINITSKVTSYVEGRIKNTACVNAPEVNPNSPDQSDDCDPAEVEVKADPEFTIVKDVKNNSQDGEYTQHVEAMPGEELGYRITFKNTGNVTLKDVVLKDQAPSGVTLVNGSAQINGQDMSQSQTNAFFGEGFNVGNVKPGEEAVVTFSVKVDNSNGDRCDQDQLVNTVFADPAGEGEGLDPKEDDATACVETDPKFSIVKSVRTKSSGEYQQGVVAMRGQTVEYRIVVSNEGDTILQNVIVKDQMPEHVDFVSGTVRVNGQEASDDYFGQGINIGSIEVGGQKVITFEAKVAEEAPTDCGTNQFTNIASADPAGEGEGLDPKEDDADVCVDPVVCDPTDPATKEDPACNPCEHDPSITKEDPRCERCEYDPSMPALDKNGNPNPDCLKPIVPGAKILPKTGGSFISKSMAGSAAIMAGIYSVISAKNKKRADQES